MRSTVISEYVLDVVRPAVRNLPGGIFFEEGERNLNLIAGRTPNTKAGLFDDWQFLAQKIDGKWDVEALRCTADAGVLLNPKPGGVGRVAEGCYKAAWEISYHHIGDADRRYPALRQCKPITIERHTDGNAYFDKVSTKKEELIYANWHAAGTNPFVDPFKDVWKPGRLVGNWSEACIVTADALEYATIFWPTILLSAAKYGPRFTGTVVQIPNVPW